MKSMTRREFCVAGAVAALSGYAAVPGTGAGPEGDLAWKRGHFQIHMIYTGKGESLFLVFPDGTSMLLDCGDSEPRKFQAAKFGDKSLPMPDEARPAGETVARYVRRVNPHGAAVDYMLLSHFHGDHCEGFPKAAETLRFRRAIDRGWPDYDDPLPYSKDPRWMGGALTGMKDLYRRLAERDGLAVEKFRVGETGQIRLLHDAAAYPDFSVFNLCGSGKVAMPNGSVADCYGPEHARHKTCVYNENAMSLGSVFTYGRFRFWTAGDFTASDGRKGVWQGRPLNVEKILAKACGPVSVAKANHHAAWACPTDLVAALRPRVWLAPVWWQLQCDRDTMSRLADKAAYPDERLILPGVMCAERRAKDAGEAYLAAVPEAVHTPSHVVVDVPPGGETYRVACLDPAGESPRVKATWTFAT